MSPRCHPLSGCHLPTVREVEPTWFNFSVVCQEAHHTPPPHPTQRAGDRPYVSYRALWACGYFAPLLWWAHRLCGSLRASDVRAPVAALWNARCTLIQQSMLPQRLMAYYIALHESSAYSISFHLQNNKTKIQTTTCTLSLVAFGPALQSEAQRASTS